MDQLMLLSFALPLLLALVVARGGRWPWLLAVAPLPALLTALLLPVGSSMHLPWLLLGTHLQLDALTQLLLLFSSLVWLATALQLLTTRSGLFGRIGFAIGFASAMAGNFLLLLAADAVTFYVGFALMGLSVYGLLLPQRGQWARRAGQVYLAFTLCGEVALFAGIALVAVSADSLLFADLAQQSLPPVAVFLLLLGFGIKLALPGLHLWLPLTYTLAPAAAVAVLSGPMMKAGLVGWMRFLPPGAPGLAEWGMPLLILGWLGVVLGVLLGVVQHKPRAVLAYSSVAKMGMISAVYGIALRHPTLAESLVPALLLFAVHHLLVKAALFLGVDLYERGGANRWLLLGLGALAAVLAAAPFTAGYAAKSALGDALHGELTLLMVFSAIGTAWLMIRFMVVLGGNPFATFALPGPAALGFAAIGVLSLSAPFSPASLGFESSSLYPLVLAALSALAARRLVVRTTQAMPRPGMVARAGVRALAVVRHWSGRPLPAFPPAAGRIRALLTRPTANVDPTWTDGGIRWLAVVGSMVLLGMAFD